MNSIQPRKMQLKIVPRATVVCLLVLVGFLSFTPGVIRAQEGSLNERALGAFEGKEYARAAELYDSVIEQNDASYGVYLKRAQAYAWSGSRNRRKAIDAYSELLNRYPDDPDGLLGRGRVYLWMKQYKQAESDITRVTTNKPDYADAWSAQGDLYLWWGKPRKALEAFNKLVEVSPREPKSYLARHRAQRNLANYSAANKDLTRALEVGASADEINELRTRLQWEITTEGGQYPSGKWEAKAGYSRQWFNNSRDEWNVYDLSVKRKFERGSVRIGGIRAQRFSRWDESLVLDLYHRLWSRAYGNLRYAHAPSPSLFPANDYLLEIFQGIGQGWEASLFGRRMEFSSSDVELWGGSLGRYYKSWYLRARGQFRFDYPNSAGTSSSYQLLARRYLKTADDYVELRYGFGKKPLKEAVFPSFSNTERKKSLGFKYRTFPWRHLGFDIGGSIGDNDGFRSKSVSANVMYRW